MSPAKALLGVLKEEEAMLVERRYDVLADIQQRKETYVSQLTPERDGDWFEQIRQQAIRNEKLMSVTLTAIRGLKSKFAAYGKETASIGYSAEGDRVAVGGAVSERRV